MTRISSVLLLSSPTIDSRGRRSGPSFFSIVFFLSLYLLESTNTSQKEKLFVVPPLPLNWKDGTIGGWTKRGVILDDDVSNNDDFVQGTTKNTKTLNRSDPLSSPLEETEEGIKEERIERKISSQSIKMLRKKASPSLARRLTMQMMTLKTTQKRKRKENTTWDTKTTNVQKFWWNFGAPLSRT